MDSISIRNQSCPKGCLASVHINSRARQRLQCAACGKTWASYADEFYFGLRIEREKIERAILLLQEGKSIRSIAQSIGVSPVTVQRWKHRLKFKKSIS